MTKLIWIVIAIAIGAFAVNANIESRAKRNAERDSQSAETLRAEQETKAVMAAVAQMVARTGAATDWAERLGTGVGYRSSPVFTIELERIWQADQPILFTGLITDISSGVGGDYLVLVEIVTEPAFLTRLRLSLHAPKVLIDAFLAKNPEFVADIGYSVAIVAKVRSITASEMRRADGDRVLVKTGVGDMLDMQYMGDILF